MKTLILGHGRHGKDTVAAIINKLTGDKFSSSSLAALDVIWPILEECKRYPTKFCAYDQRHNDRELWKRLIALYNAADPGALCKKILQDNDIYVGMRRQEEYEATKHLFDRIIYVEASERVKERDSTMEVAYDPSCMLLIENNTTVQELTKKVEKLCSTGFAL